MLDALGTLVPPRPIAARLGLAPPLALRRAWPGSETLLRLEYLDDRGRLVPGQWMADPDPVARMARATARRCGKRAIATVPAAGGSVLLQPGGADRRLVGLAGALVRPGAALVSHRPERRAVVRVAGAGPRCSNGSAAEQYLKVVPPARVAALAGAARQVWALPRRPFAAPAVLEVDAEGGVVALAALAGTALSEHRERGALAAAAGAVAPALRWLHESAPRRDVPVHDAAAEIELLRRQLRRLAAFAPAVAARTAARSEEVFAGLADGASPGVMLHRDLYDKQILIQSGGRIAILDFDTLSWGEAALDVANMLGHLELRALQGRCPEDAACAAAAAFLAAYDPPLAVRWRIPAYLDATRLRLACVYAFRPRFRELPGELLGRIGAATGIGSAE